MNFMHSFGFVCRDSGVLKIAGYEIVAVKLINSKVLKKEEKIPKFLFGSFFTKSGNSCKNQSRKIIMKSELLRSMEENMKSMSWIKFLVTLTKKKKTHTQQILKLM